MSLQQQAAKLRALVLLTDFVKRTQTSDRKSEDRIYSYCKDREEVELTQQYLVRLGQLLRLSFDIELDMANLKIVVILRKDDGTITVKKV